MEKEITVQNNIESKILSLRGKQVMMDRDLAELYGVETRVLNQAVKRNIERFPEDFMFALEESEKTELVTNCDRFNSLKHSTVAPYAFTEQGVAMLSAVLRSEKAVRVSIEIMNAFVQMRHYLHRNLNLAGRLTAVENKVDSKFKTIDDKNFRAKAWQFLSGRGFDGEIISAAVENFSKGD